MFWIGNGKMKDSEVNDCKPSQNLVCFIFLMNIILICYCHVHTGLFELCSIFEEYKYISYIFYKILFYISGDKNIYLPFFFTSVSKPASLLVSDRVPLFSLMALIIYFIYLSYSV